jgi:hypothetical protein
MNRSINGAVNGAEFFMRYFGARLLPQHLATGDAVSDFGTLSSMPISLSTGASMRLSSCWAVITPHSAATSLKLPAAVGLDTTFSEYRLAKLAALRALRDQGEPFLLLKLGKRTLAASDLLVTWDVRAVRECSQGSVKTYDATEELSMHESMQDVDAQTTEETA